MDVRTNVYFTHTIQASFDSTIDIYHRINIFITLSFIIYIYERKSYLLLWFIPFYLLYIQIPTPDILITFGALIIINEICFYYENEKLKTLFIISIFLFTVKPIIFWLPLFIFIIGLFKDRKYILDYKSLLLSGILLSIYCFKNFITSSLLFYPITITKIPETWSVNQFILNDSDLEAIRYSYNFLIPIEKAQTFSILDKLYFWLTVNKLEVWVHIFIFIFYFLFE